MSEGTTSSQGFPGPDLQSEINRPGIGSSLAGISKAPFTARETPEEIAIDDAEAMADLPPDQQKAVSTFTGRPEHRPKELHAKHPQVVQAKRLEKIRGLVTRLAGGVVIYDTQLQEAWRELVSMFPPPKDETPRETEVKPVGWDDPTDVRLAKVNRLPVNPRMTNIVMAGGGLPQIMWGKGSDKRLRLGAAVSVRPNPNRDEGGFVLWGVYNKYGVRIR